MDDLHLDCQLEINDLIRTIWSVGNERNNLIEELQQVKEELQQVKEELQQVKTERDVMKAAIRFLVALKEISELKEELQQVKDDRDALVAKAALERAHRHGDAMYNHYYRPSATNEEV